jgi:hypothetical protein
MNTSTHPIAAEEVMAFLDSELSAADAQAVSAHLEHCAECSVLVEQFRGTSQSLSRWSVQAVPAELEKSVTDLAGKTRSGPKIRKANIFIRASFWTWKRWTAELGALAAVLVLLIVASSTNRFSRSDSNGRLSSGSTEKSRLELYAKIQAPSQVDGQPISNQQSKVPTDQIVAQQAQRIAPDSNGNFHGLGDQIQDALSVSPVPMIARTVSLSIVVKDFVAARATLDVFLARHHSYAAELTANTAENAPRSLQASLRVPAPELAAMLSELKSLGRVENESQSGEEVTQQHADLVARLKNSRETEQRLKAILIQRTGKISDILQVEQEIARVRGEIEQMEAEQKTLEHRVEFAAVNLNLTEEYKAQLNAPAASVSTRIHNAFVAGYRNASETVLGVVMFFAEYSLTIVIWLMILALPVLLIWRRYRRTLATV